MNLVKNICTVIPVVVLTATAVLATGAVMGLGYLTVL
jgi:hypothetical protein